MLDIKSVAKKIDELMEVLQSTQQFDSLDEENKKDFYKSRNEMKTFIDNLPVKAKKRNVSIDSFEGLDMFKKHRVEINPDGKQKI